MATFVLENKAGTSLFDFLSDVDYITGTFVTGSSGEPVVTDTLRFVIQDTSANIRADIHELDQHLQQAIRYMRDNKRIDPVFLAIQADGETVKRRSLVHNYSMQVEGTEYSDTLLGMAQVTVTLSLTHDAWWESATEETQSWGASISKFGGGVTITGDADGTLDGRIAQIFPYGASSQIQRLWFGIKPVREGITNFEPRIDCYAAGQSEADAAQDTDAAWYGGNAWAIDFNTTDSMEDKVKITIPFGSNNVNWEDYVGSYVVLLRYSFLTNPTNNTDARVAVRMKSGDYDYQLHTHKWVELDLTYSKATKTSRPLIAELGIMSIPAIPRPDLRAATYSPDAPYLTDYHIVLGASRLNTGRTVTVYFDALCLMPYEHYVKMVYSPSGAHNADRARIFTNPDGVITSLAEYDPGTAYIVSRPGTIEASNNWSFPYEGGLLVNCAEFQGSSGNPTTNWNGIDTAVNHRWASYTG